MTLRDATEYNWIVDKCEITLHHNKNEEQNCIQFWLARNNSPVSATQSVKQHLLFFLTPILNCLQKNNQLYAFAVSHQPIFPTTLLTYINGGCAGYECDICNYAVSICYSAGFVWLRVWNKVKNCAGNVATVSTI